MLWTTANYSFFIRPGMKRIAIQPTHAPVSDLEAATSVMASAYTDGKQIVAVFINYSAEEKNIKINCKGYKQAKMYVTSIDKDLQHIGTRQLSSIQIPARSVATLVLNE